MKEKFEIVADNLHLKGVFKYVFLGVIVVLLFIGVNFLFSLFKKDDKIESEVIFQLNGNKVTTLYVYDEFVDKGFIAKDGDIDISSSVIVNGKVDTSVPGVYDVIYKLNYGSKNLVLERTYVVVDKDGSYIELSGPAIVYIEKNGVYIEYGYNAVDYAKGNVSDSVVVSGEVNTNIPGDYIINYEMTTSNGEVKKIQRIVKVGESLSNDLDFVLIGLSNIEVAYGTEYIEPGYKAIDKVDGDITSKVLVNGEVKNNVAGNYTIKYTVINSDGVQKVLFRNVKVLSEDQGILTLTLSGSENMSINYNSEYKEPGYKAIDSIDGDITDKVNVIKKIDTSVAGKYFITYRVTNSTGITKSIVRTVVVLPQVVGKTELVLNGNEKIEVAYGSDFNDPGVKVVDSVDGDITDKVIVEGKVNTSVPGTYQVKYSVTNSAGVTTTIERKVVVSRNVSINIVNLTGGYTNKPVDLEITITGDSFKEVVLPDGKKMRSKKFKYTVTENGSYTFKAYTESGSVVSKTHNVSNIDSEAPTGTCVAHIENKKVTVETSIIDSGIGIKGFIYRLDGNASDLIKETTYNYDSDITAASVSAYDRLDNERKIPCNIIREKEIYAPGRHFVVSYRNSSLGDYWLSVPDDYMNDKKPFVIFLHGSGEIGENTSVLKQFAFYKQARHGITYNAVVMMPQLRGGTWIGVRTELKELIDAIVKEYNIDETRISISGHSLGAIGTYAMINTYPGFFSAAAPISGRYELSYARRLSKTPIWAFHGRPDYNVSYSVDKSLIDAVSAAGGNAQLTTLDGWGHGIVNRVFDEFGIEDWLITSQREDK